MDDGGPTAAASGRIRKILSRLTGRQFDGDVTQK